jgi:hypothetical protein
LSLSGIVEYRIELNKAVMLPGNDIKKTMLDICGNMVGTIG